MSKMRNGSGKEKISFVQKTKKGLNSPFFVEINYDSDKGSGAEFTITD
mgnify:CR=1 FL=1